MADEEDFFAEIVATEQVEEWLAEAQEVNHPLPRCVDNKKPIYMVDIANSYIVRCCDRSIAENACAYFGKAQEASCIASTHFGNRRERCPSHRSAGI